MAETDAEDPKRDITSVTNRRRRADALDFNVVGAPICVKWEGGGAGMIHRSIRIIGVWCVTLCEVCVPSFKRHQKEWW